MDQESKDIVKFFSMCTAGSVAVWALAVAAVAIPARANADCHSGERAQLELTTQAQRLLQAGDALDKVLWDDPALVDQRRAQDEALGTLADHGRAATGADSHPAAQANLDEYARAAARPSAVSIESVQSILLAGDPAQAITAFNEGVAQLHNEAARAPSAGTLDCAQRKELAPNVGQLTADARAVPSLSPPVTKGSAGGRPSSVSVRPAGLQR